MESTLSLAVCLFEVIERAAAHGEVREPPLDSRFVVLTLANTCQRLVVRNDAELRTPNLASKTLGGLDTTACFKFKRAVHCPTESWLARLAWVKDRAEVGRPTNAQERSPLIATPTVERREARGKPYPWHLQGNSCYDRGSKFCLKKWSLRMTGLLNPKIVLEIHFFFFMILVVHLGPGIFIRSSSFYFFSKSVFGKRS